MTAPNRPGPTASARSDGVEPPVRPALTQLRLSAYGAHRDTTVPLGPLTFLTGPSGSGKTTVLEAYEALARLGGGAALADAFPDAASRVPQSVRPAAGGRRVFRIGCTAEGPAGSVHLDLAVQAEPDLRVVGERLTAGRVTLLVSACRDPRRRAVQAAWHTGAAAPAVRGWLPDDRLGTALLPLRVAGSTEGQRLVLAAAEQMVVALRSVFACDPRPCAMREPVPRAGGRLLRGCGNLAEVVARTRAECGRRHMRLVAAVRAGCAGPVRDLRTQRCARDAVRAVLDRGDGIATPMERLGDGELRYLALALVLLTGPAVLEVEPAAEVPAAYQALTVLADGFDRCLDTRQARELTRLAAEMCDRGHLRLIASLHAGAAVPAVPAGGGAGRITVVRLGP